METAYALPGLSTTTLPLLMLPSCPPRTAPSARLSVPAAARPTSANVPVRHPTFSAMARPDLHSSPFSSALYAGCPNASKRVKEGRTKQRRGSASSSSSSSDDESNKRPVGGAVPVQGGGAPVTQGKSLLYTSNVPD